MISNITVDITSTPSKPQKAVKLDLFFGSSSCRRKRYTTHLLHYNTMTFIFTVSFRLCWPIVSIFCPECRRSPAAIKPGFGHQEGLAVICQCNLLSSQMEIHHQIQVGLCSARRMHPLTWREVTCLTPLRLTTFQINVKPPHVLMRCRHDTRTLCCMVMVVDYWCISLAFRALLDESFYSPLFLK